MAAPVREGISHLGRYLLFDEIASGGMATVHLGRLLGAAGFSRTVAIKRMHPQFAKEPEFVSMFINEARLASRIQHPNVVPTLDVISRDGELLLGATLLLRKGDPQEIAARMEAAKSQRMSTQPHGARSAGCFFKNAPASPIGTGKMIDGLGMKGTRRGGAVVSPKHANFIVTEGDDAKAADALALAEEIRERVKQEHGIDLEYEVELWSSK